MIQRLKQITKTKAGSVKKLAEALGISENTIEGYMRGKNKVALNFIVDVLRTYPDISAEWLLRGEGDMYRNANSNVNNYEINSHSTVHKGNVSGSYNNTSADLQQEVKTLKEKERLYLMQIAELKNDKTFLQNLLSKTS